MNIKNMIYNLLLNIIPIIATIYIIVGIKLFRQKIKSKISYFSFLMFACAIYSFGYFFELNCKKVDVFLVVRNVEFLGSVFIPTFGILFIAQLTDFDISKKVKTVLFTVSALLWLLFVSNPIHHWIYKSINLRVVEGFGIVDALRGPVFYSMMIYYTVFLIFSIIVLSKSYKRENKANRKNALLFLQASFQVPWFAIIFIISDFDTYIDPVPITIMILAGLFAINEVKNNMFELQKIKWKNTYENIGEPAILIDKAENVVCSNVIANTLFYNQVKNIYDIVEKLNEAERNNRQVCFETNSGIKWFNIKKSKFDIKKGFISYLLIDITEGKLAEEHLKESERSKSVLLSNLPGMSYRCSFSRKWTMEFLSKGCYELTGYKEYEFQNNNLLSFNDIILPEYREYLWKYWEEAVSSRKPVMVEYRIRTADQKEKWVMEQGIPIYDDEGKVEALEGFITDINHRKMFETALSNEKELFKTTLLSVGDGVISTDNNGDIVFLNKAAEQLTGWLQAEAFGKSLDEVFNIINEFTRERCENPVYKVLNTGCTIELERHTSLISKDNMERPIEDTVAPIKDEKGNINGVVLVFRDFTEKKRRQEEIERLSYHDHLTGLYNRRFYMEELARLDTENKLPLTIVMGDVNGLKLINDSFGHEMGDELLNKVAGVLRLGCRENDIIARLGGDEFVIILPKTNGFETEQIVKHINDLSLKEKVGSMDISISFGYETKNTEEERIEEIFKKAEDHMYRKKLFESPSMRGKTISAIIKTLHEKNKREEQHSHRVSDLCKRMGEVLRLPEYKIQELKTIGLLHDIGKIAIDENILNKHGKLTDAEFNEIKRHPEIGYRILNTVNDMSDMAKCILNHHERWDGKGYPKGLKGEDIPFVSRIIAIVDAYDAMTSDRSYRNALPEKLVIEELQKNAGSQFDPELLKAFIQKVLYTPLD